jgi:hypothetical protein
MARVVVGLGLWLCGAKLLMLLAAPVVAHPSWTAAHPSDIVWVVAAILIALGLVRLNHQFAWADYLKLPAATYGVLAAIVAFTVQDAINGPLVRYWSNGLTWQHHLLLGPVAAGAQTLGKCFALVVLFTVRPQASLSDWLRLGLLVGLGFTVYEISLIYSGMASAQQAVVSYGGLCERASASVFHIYSGGLLALALATGRSWPLALVLAVHAWSDFLAGAGVSLGFSVAALEWGFGMWALALWVVFLVASRSKGARRISGYPAEPGGAANRSQPVGSETNRTSSATGSGG